MVHFYYNSIRGKKDMPKPLNTSNHTWSTLETSIKLLVHLKVGSSCRNSRIWFDPRFSWTWRCKKILKYLKSYIKHFVALFVKINFYDSNRCCYFNGCRFYFVGKRVSKHRRFEASYLPKKCQSSPETVHFGLKENDEIWIPTLDLTRLWIIYDYMYIYDIYIFPPCDYVSHFCNNKISLCRFSSSFSGVDLHLMARTRRDGEKMSMRAWTWLEVKTSKIKQQNNLVISGKVWERCTNSLAHNISQYTIL